MPTEVIVTRANSATIDRTLGAFHNRQVAEGNAQNAAWATPSTFGGTQNGDSTDRPQLIQFLEITMSSRPIYSQKTQLDEIKGC